MTEGAEGQLTNSEVVQIKNKIVSGSSEAALVLVVDTVSFFKEDLEAIRERRDFLFEQFRNQLNSVAALGGICYLSALLGDTRFCDFWLRSIEEQGKGYYSCLVGTVFESKGMRTEAEFFHDRAARLGYIPSLVYKKRQKLERFGIFGRMAFYIYRYGQGVRAAILAVFDPNDPRVPTELLALPSISSVKSSLLNNV